MIDVSATIDRFQLREVFTISRGSRTEAEVVTVTVKSGPHQGRGECVPYKRYGETPDSVLAQIAAMAKAVGNEADPIAALQSHPAGAARNALDCALWDLRAKATGRPVWELLNLPAPTTITTAFTLSLEDPDVMREKAAIQAARPLLKIKLGGEGDLARLEAVREGAPKAAIVVDANEGWTAESYAEIAPTLIRLGVKMVEQPLPAGDDAALADIERPLPVCADESCHTSASLGDLAGKYDMVNIKLDKTGGLTEALKLRDAARAQGFQVMMGCMVGTSLAMAPAVLVAQGAEVIDLDGPLLLDEDRTPPITFKGSTMSPAPPTLWG